MDGGLRFNWDAHNIRHLALHHVGIQEAEQALAGELMDLNYSVTAGGEERWTAAGQTEAGRILVIVWTVLEDGSHRAITSYPATKGLEAVYLRLTKGE